MYFEFHKNEMPYSFFFNQNLEKIYETAILSTEKFLRTRMTLSFFLCFLRILLLQNGTNFDVISCSAT